MGQLKYFARISVFCLSLAGLPSITRPDNCESITKEAACNAAFGQYFCTWVTKGPRCEFTGLARTPIEIGDDRTKAISAIQRKLNELEKTKIRTDGAYGKETENAVKAFQSKNGVPITGKVDKFTAEQLFKQ